MDINQEIEFPLALHFLITESSRYKILYGGRGGAKTESIALALVILGSEKRLRIACFREFQSSISESVHAIIKQKIYDIGREDEWNITDKSIVSKRTGTEFIFSGLRYNIDKIKSMSRIDIAWVEEARNVSKTSWDKLGPTIRGRYKDDPNGQGGPFGEGPEIWVSFNPELAGDETYKRFILKPPSEYDVNGKRYSIIKKVNWTDNKFFPDDLRAEMEEMRLKDQDKYLEVWEGHTKIVLDGAIYANEIKEVLLSQPCRRGKVPYNSNKPVFTCWDLGHSDKTAIWFVQKIGMEFNLIHYYENSLKKIPFYIKYLQDCGYVYEKHYLPHDGDAETLSNVTPKKQLRDAKLGDVRIVKRPSKKYVGINAVRSVFPLCNFDEENTADGWQCLTNYCYKVDADTGTFSKEPDHDTPWSHGCFTGDTEILTSEGLKAISTLPETGKVLTQWGWSFYVRPRLTRKNASLVEVCFTNGYMVKCTPDHLFLTEEGWKFAKNLETGLLIQSGLTKLRNFSMEESIKYIPAKLILKPLVHYIEKFGLMLSEQYQRIVIFITKMKTNLIINYIIWNVYLGKNTYNLAGNYFLIKEELKIILHRKLELKHLNGINRSKADYGIKNNHLKFGLKHPKFVLFVKQNLMHGVIKNIASVNANLKHVLNDVVIKLNQIGMRTNYVKFVGNFLKLNLKVVGIKYVAPKNVEKLIIKEVKLLNEKSDVYCLTVPDVGHFALANGAIVKNCDGMQTFALSLKSESEEKKPTKIVSERHNFRPTATGWLAG